MSYARDLALKIRADPIMLLSGLTTKGELSALIATLIHIQKHGNATQ